MKKNLIVKQDGYKECGAASLLSIIRYYGGNISINKLVDLTKTDKFGTNFYNIKSAALELGLESIGYKIDEIDKLNEVRCPIMCQIIEKNYEHFVVIYKIKKNKLFHKKSSIIIIKEGELMLDVFIESLIDSLKTISVIFIFAKS